MEYKIYDVWQRIEINSSYRLKIMNFKSSMELELF